MAISNDPYTDNKPWQQYNVRDNKIYEGVTVFRGITDMGENAYQLCQSSEVDYHIDLWKSTEEGQWCMEKAVETKVVKEPDDSVFGYRYAICCLFTPKDATFYRMKWGGQSR